MTRLIFIVFSLVVSVIVIFGAGNAVLNGSSSPLMQQIFLGKTDQGLKALLAEKAQLNEAISNARALDSKIEKLTEAKNSINPEDLAKLDKFIPSHIDNVNLIIDINNIANRHGMVIKNVKVRSGNENTDEANQSGDRLTIASSQNKIADTYLSFSVSGNYDSLLGFLDSLAGSLRVADVNTLSFSVDSKGVNQYNFEVKTYWVK